MHTIAAIYTSRSEAERTAVLLEALGIPSDRITILDARERGRSAARPTRARPPGTGAAIGAVVGGATGAAVGLPLGAAITLLVPGIGPVIAVGLLGAALFGAGGAAVGSALEESLVTGMPRDDRFVYETALRRGRSVLLALEEDAMRAAEAQRIVDSSDAESVDEASRSSRRRSARAPSRANASRARF